MPRAATSIIDTAVEAAATSDAGDAKAVLADALATVTKAGPAVVAASVDAFAAAVAEIQAKNPTARPEEVLAAAAVVAIQPAGSAPATVRSAVDLVLAELTSGSSHAASRKPGVVRRLVASLVDSGHWPWLVGSLRDVLTSAALQAGAPGTPIGVKPDEPGLVPVDSAAPGDGPPTPPDGLLAGGADGGDVDAVQRQLGRLGFDPGPADGRYGPLTTAAVRAFQEHAGLEADGVVGPETWGALWSSPA